MERKKERKSLYIGEGKNGIRQSKADIKAVCSCQSALIKKTHLNAIIEELQLLILYLSKFEKEIPFCILVSSSSQFISHIRRYVTRENEFEISLKKQKI